MLKPYAERSPKPADLHAFDPALSAENGAEIAGFLQATEVEEVLGAWGDLPGPILRPAEKEALAMLHSINVRVYHYGALTLRGIRGPELSR